MSGMNSWLAEIYGTDGADDLEKTAQAHILQKLAEENNLDLSQFSPEELQQLLVEVLGPEAAAEQMGAVPGAALQQPGQQPGQGMNPQMGQPAQQGMPQQTTIGQNGLPQQARPQQAFAPAAPQAQQQQPQGQQGMQPYQMAPQGGQDQASLQKEAQAKFEEADLLGRVMAHAYTQELEKIAGSRMESAKAAVKGVAGKARDAAASAHGSAKGYASRAAGHVKAHKGAYGAGAAAAGGFAAGRMSKKASAFEKLAEMHAADILGAAGFDPSTGMDTTAQQQPQQQTQQPQPADVQQQVQTEQQQMGGVMQPGQPQTSEPGAEFSQALDNRALEMLEAAGYDVNEILARLQLSQNPGQA